MAKLYMECIKDFAKSCNRNVKRLLPGKTIEEGTTVLITTVDAILPMLQKTGQTKNPDFIRVKALILDDWPEILKTVPKSKHESLKQFGMNGTHIVITAEQILGQAVADANELLWPVATSSRFKKIFNPSNKQNDAGSGTIDSSAGRGSYTDDLPSNKKSTLKVPKVERSSSSSSSSSARKSDDRYGSKSKDENKGLKPNRKFEEFKSKFKLEEEQNRERSRAFAKSEIAKLEGEQTKSKIEVINVDDRELSQSRSTAEIGYSKSKREFKDMQDREVSQSMSIAEIGYSKSKREFKDMQDREVSQSMSIAEIGYSKSKREFKDMQDREVSQSMSIAEIGYSKSKREFKDMQDREVSQSMSIAEIGYSKSKKEFKGVQARDLSQSMSIAEIGYSKSKRELQDVQDREQLSQSISNAEKEYSRAQSELKGVRDKELELYIQTPEVHPDYEEKYSIFIDQYKQQYGGKHDLEHCKRLWKAFWKELVTATIKEEYDIKLKALESEYTLNKDKIGQDSLKRKTSTDEQLGPKEKYSRKEEKAGDINQRETLQSQEPILISDNNEDLSLEDTLRLLEEVSPVVGILGPAVQLLVKKIRNCRSVKTEMCKLLEDEDNRMILQRVSQKIGELSEVAGSGPHALKLKLASRQALTLLQVPMASSDKQENYGLDVKEIARATYNRDPTYIIDYIKDLLIKKGVSNASKDEVTDLYIAVTTAHLKEAFNRPEENIPHKSDNKRLVGYGFKQEENSTRSGGRNMEQDDRQANLLGRNFGGSSTNYGHLSADSQNSQFSRSNMRDGIVGVGHSSLSRDYDHSKQKRETDLSNISRGYGRSDDRRETAQPKKVLAYGQFQQNYSRENSVRGGSQENYSRGNSVRGGSQENYSRGNSQGNYSRGNSQGNYSRGNNGSGGSMAQNSYGRESSQYASSNMDYNNSRNFNSNKTEMENRSQDGQKSTDDQGGLSMLEFLAQL